MNYGQSYMVYQDSTLIAITTTEEAAIAVCERAREEANSPGAELMGKLLGSIGRTGKPRLFIVPVTLGEYV